MDTDLGARMSASRENAHRMADECLALTGRIHKCTNDADHSRLRAHDLILRTGILLSRIRSLRRTHEVALRKSAPGPG